MIPPPTQTKGPVPDLDEHADDSEIRFVTVELPG